MSLCGINSNFLIALGAGALVRIQPGGFNLMDGQRNLLYLPMTSWQSLVYCSSLLNCRRATVRRFESYTCRHSFARSDGTKQQHDRGHSRKMDWKHAKRKRTIIRDVMGVDWYDSLHQYSKNKIHCSCCLCRPRKSWGHNPNSITSNSIADQRRLQAMRRAMEYDFENDAG